MSMGLLVRSAGGGTVLDSNSYTVRLADTFVSPAGKFNSPVRYTVPLAKAGMFAALSHYGTFNHTNPDNEVNLMDEARKAMPVMPAVTVGDGWIELYSPLRASTLYNGHFTGPVIVYVFAYL